MILYFADRQLNIIGQASTHLPNGLTVTEDKKTEDVETGVAVFECKIPFDRKSRDAVEQYTEVGNYILRSQGGENEFYTIIDAEIDTKDQTVYIYAEDDGMDLLNEVVGEYEADKAYPISYYIQKYAASAGFVIGINEVKSLTRQLSWDGESTASERITSIAAQFDGCEISYSFDVDGLMVIKKYINIYKKRGQDIGITLRLNEDVDRIVTTKSIGNLATALYCTGGTPQDEDTGDDQDPVPITLKGYKYDDGDFYVDGDLLKSRKALKRWSRYLWKTNDTQKSGGHIVKLYSYDTLSQKELCAHAVTELEKICEMEVNYEVDITKFPANASIGDRINIVDNAGNLYVSARILKLETSVTEDEHTATLGEYLIKTSGISQKVADLASQFAQNSQSAARALAIANTAKNLANQANDQAGDALQSAVDAQEVSAQAQASADAALSFAQTAQAAADAAAEAVQTVEESVGALESVVESASQAAENANQAAITAGAKAEEAKQAAQNAAADAEDAKQAAQTAQETAQTAAGNAQTAQNTAQQAMDEATSAQHTASAAKEDAQLAQQEIDALGEQLTTVENTMQADYARKTDLTEATASLQTQIAQNAEEIRSTASKVQVIDETANSAKEASDAAQSTAAQAQQQANQAAQAAADAAAAASNAQQTASAAQSEADAAKLAAQTAKSVADQAQTDLEAAQENLQTVQGRVDATEAEIAAAQEAVNTAQAAADEAKVRADAAARTAENAQEKANTAAEDAANAQLAANDAASKANLAQQTADAAKGDAQAAQTAAQEAADAAAEAQRTAGTAADHAAAAQTTADAAKEAAQAAQTAAADADQKAAAAQSDLDAAKQHLADVTSRVDATEEEVAAAQAAVSAAQTAADAAKAEAQAAQHAADTAKADAQAAQSAADTAKAEADAAKSKAEAAQQAADAAKEEVDALAVRVTEAETNIQQNAEQIALSATKTEVAETLGGYYTKEQTDAAITLKADEIHLSIESTAQELTDQMDEKLTEQETDLTAAATGIILSALESYVQTGDFDAFRQTVRTELELLADQIVMNFTTTTENLNGLDSEMQDRFSEWSKYIRFSADGITIGADESALTLQLDNNQIQFVKNGVPIGWWDGVEFHTGNLVVEVNERARFGDFAFVPRSDGSLMFLKVGGE